MKKKIRLDLNDLKVESFVTSEGGRTLKDGTVFGMAATVCEDTCQGVGDTCNGGECDSDAGVCNWTTAQHEPSCTGDTEDPGGGTIPPPPTIGDTCDETCPELPNTCDGVICQPD